MVNESEDLKYRIRELENAQKSSELRTNVMEREMEDARKELNKIEEDNNTIRLQLERLTKTIQRMTEEREQKEEEDMKWKKEISENLERLQSSGRRSPSLPDLVDDACSLLGQMCSRVQAMMYKIVLPESHVEEYSYKVKFIKEDIESKEGDLKRQAIERWDELKRRLSWDDINHPRILKEIQRERKIVVHPSLLTKDFLLKSAKLMQEAGKLHGRKSLTHVHEIIEIWDLLVVESSSEC